MPVELRPRRPTMDATKEERRALRAAQAAQAGYLRSLLK
jgi:hypothetical protein